MSGAEGGLVLRTSLVSEFCFLFGSLVSLKRGEGVSEEEVICLLILKDFTFGNNSK